MRNQKILPRYKECFVCGKQNTLGLNLTFKTDGSCVSTTTSLDTRYNGYIGYVHGGILTTLLDEAMCWACISYKKWFYFTVDINIRFLAPVRPEDEITVNAQMVSEKGRILVAQGVILDSQGKECVKANGKFYPAPDKDNKEIFTYLHHEPEDGRPVKSEDL